MLTLTIAIPTYNRPEQIIKKLLFLENEILRLDLQFKNTFEVFISDNASNLLPDDKGYRDLLNRLNVRFHRQKNNIGLVRNYCFCIDQALGDFIWVVGDDDELSNGLLASIIELVHQTKNLGLIYVNHVHKANYDDLRLFLEKPSLPTYYDNFSDFMKKHFDFHGLMKITANVMKTSSAKQAVNDYHSWHLDKDNLALPLYVSCSTGNNGNIAVINSISISCHEGKSDWEVIRCYWYLCDIPFILDKLKKIGLRQKQIDSSLIDHYSKYTIYIFKQFALKTRENPKKLFEHLRLIMAPLSHWQWYWATIQKIIRIFFKK